MVRTERAFLDQLGIERLAAVAGGSLGGMQAFEWAIMFPDMSTPSWRSPARTRCTRRAWRGTQSPGRRSWATRPGSRDAITARMTPDRRPGRGAHDRPHHLPLGRGARREVRPRRLQFAKDLRYTIVEPEFEVESYLRHQADSFVTRFDANTYLYTSRALTYFDLAREHGGGSLARALEGVSARTLLISFSSDWLYPPSGASDIEEALRGLRKPVELHVIDAPYGHDCFLLEEAQQTPIIRRFLHEPA